MKVLLLGKSGQLGGDLMDYFSTSENGNQYLFYSRSDLDIEDLDNLKAHLQDQDFDLLINCTSVHKTDQIEIEAASAFRVNVRAVKVMAACCNAKGSKFMHISTDYVFGAGHHKVPINENTLAAPLNVYGASKALGERLALIENPSTYILRVASLFGVRGASGKGGNFIETMLKLSSENDEIKVVNDQFMSPSFTEDVAKMIGRLIEKPVCPGIYHLVNSGKATWYDLADYVVKKVGNKCSVLPCTSNEFPTIAMRPNYSVLDNSKAILLLGEIPHWENAVDRYLKKKGHI